MGQRGTVSVRPKARGGSVRAQWDKMGLSRFDPVKNFSSLGVLPAIIVISFHSSQISILI